MIDKELIEILEELAEKVTEENTILKTTLLVVLNPKGVYASDQ